jgi:hypothetical protein
MKRWPFFIWSLLLPALFLTSCDSTPVEQRELYGLWKANYSDAEDTIEIKSDGTYLHKYIQKGLPDLINSGTWDLDPFDSSGYQRVSFKDFVSCSLIDKKSDPGYFLPVIERDWGNIILDFDPDDKFGFHYSKIK